MTAVALLLLLPQLRDNNPLTWDFFDVTPKQKPPLSYAKAVSLAAPAVVNIYSNDLTNNTRLGKSSTNITKLGSGVIMESNGYIMTNFHVVQNADLIIVILQTGQQYPAELVGFDVLTDLAVLKVNAENLPVIPQKQEITPLVGDVVLAIGNPLNLGQTVTQGIVSGTGRNGLSATSYLEFLQMDAAINKGNSGGALVNTNGELVAINSRNFTQTNPQLNIQGIFFAVPYQLANKIMKKIITHGRVVRGWLGITSNYHNNVKGFVIDEVAPNSPAQKAGLIPGDLVTEIAGTSIKSINQALDIIAETIPGTTLSFKLYRETEAMEIAVTITEYQAK